MAVERDGVVRGHAVFGDDERRSIALIEEFRPPIERIRANRPADGRSRFADCARHFFIAFGVVGGAKKTAVVDILRVEIQRLADQSQVVFPALRQRAEKMPAGFRIMAQHYRIAPPGDVKRPEIAGRHVEIRFTRGFHISRSRGERNGRVAARRIAHAAIRNE